ncbi:MAG: GNAT family N-acetyltransferase [Candidatus Sericytochromatia bacterium]
MENIIIRNAIIKDLEFLVQADLSSDGYTSLGEQQVSNKEHTEKIKNFITNKNKGALVAIKNEISIGCLMYNIVNIDNKLPDYSIFYKLDRNLFPKDGNIIEIFQLWIKPDFRKKGIAKSLKIKLEEIALNLKINAIYTHTEEVHEVVLKLNKGLGYKEIRRGPIWDEIIRVSLIKNL